MTIAAISARLSNSTPWRGAAEAAVRPQQDAPAVAPLHPARHLRKERR